MKNYILLFLFVLLSLLNFAQLGKTENIANQKFLNGNFEAALEDYLALLEKEPTNNKYLFRVGVCYLNSNIDKTKAVSYFERIIQSGKVENLSTYYLLGRAYHFAGRYDDAIRMFNRFKELDKYNASNVQDVDKQIEYCYNAKELVKYPLDVTFENLGNNINSKFADYYPFVPEDETFLVFNSRRDESSEVEEDGQYKSNIYISKVKDGVFGVAKPIESINTKDRNQEVIGLSNNGDHMLLFIEDKDYNGKIYISEISKNGIKQPELLPAEINMKDEIAASITNDGDAIFFASNRPGGIGGVDIWVSRKLPNGKWGPAQNLGPSINTPFDEDFPNISSDGKTLYFSSKGHTSMGGYDIFKAEYDEVNKTWGKVRNVGYPVNSAGDDMNLRMSETGRHGYMSSLRKGGKGDLDIYRVTFNQVEPKFMVIKGLITSENPELTLKDISIQAQIPETGDIFGDYLPNPNTGRYIIILPPGTYELLFSADGHKPLLETVSVQDISNIQSEIEKNITLKVK
jgi:tetratricopeptide (TPR) repeat protein